MSGRKSRNKGANGEREVCKILSDVWPEVSRNLTQTRDGGHDILGTPYTVEVKSQKRPSVYAAWRQCLAAAETTKKEPLVITKETGSGQWLVTMRIEEFVDLQASCKGK